MKVVSILVLVAFSIFCLYSIAMGSPLSSKENLLLSILLTISSSLFSWYVSHYYATLSSDRENTKFIDRIAEQSSEKILNQSRQLWVIERYLRKKEDILLNGGEDRFNSILHIDAVIEMIRLIRSSNNTYLNDWASIISSNDIRNKLITQTNAQHSIFDDIELLVKNPENSDEASQRILDNLKYMPEGFARELGFVTGVASLINQNVKKNTEKISQGKIIAHLNKKSKNFTVTGKFYPHLSNKPNIRIRIERTPKNFSDIEVTANTGTLFDFHVHVKATNNLELPVGKYIFEYIAEAKNTEQDIDFLTENNPGNIV